LSLSRPIGRLGRAFSPYRQRLVLDSFSFAEATVASARSGSAGLASPRMKTALSRWRADTRAALRQIQGLPRRVPGRSAALQTLQTLDTALLYLNRSFTTTNTQRAAATAAAARLNMDRYRELDAKLQRWLR